jgi:ribosomal protein RSM22 (predicted rRNA methylase)
MSLDDLRAAVEQIARDVPQRELAAAFDRIAVSYGGPVRRTSTDSVVDAVAYAVGRAPGTYTAASRVLREIAAVRPDWEPASLLDVGAGTASASWAAADVFPSLREITLVEGAEEMSSVGRRIAAAGPSPLAEAAWVAGDAARPPAGRFDLVISSYVLGELPTLTRAEAVCRWFDATEDELAILEPGSRDGFAIVRAARDQLIVLKASITAPCPHEAPCPMQDDDWCHFGVRLQRTSLQRRVKSGDRGFEDEKFSYVAASKQHVSHARARRILRRPERQGGHVRLHVCTADGTAREIVVAKRERERYRRARGAEWGETFEE